MNRSSSAVALFLAMFLMSPAKAVVFEVNSSAHPGDGICNLAECTLAEALDAANATEAHDVIEFDIPGPGPHIIVVDEPLFTSQPATINGYTQPGALPNTNTPAQGGSNAVIQIGLHLPSCEDCALFALSEGSVLRGLSLTGGVEYLLYAHGGAVTPGDMRVEGCFVGLAPDGVTLSEPRARYAVYAAAEFTLGGTDPAARNVIAGYDYAGVALRRAGGVIEGNLIGHDRTGTRALVDEGEMGYGIASSFMQNGVHPLRIGGAAMEQRNVIYGSWAAAIFLECSNTYRDCLKDTRIQGNYLQTDVSGRNLGSQYDHFVPTYAIRLHVHESPGRIVIGGEAPGEGNVIARGPDDFGHITLRDDRTSADSPLTVSFLGNRFLRLRETDRPIDITSEHNATAEDPGDADTGINRRQNRPEILSVSWSESTTQVQYRVDSMVSASSYPLRIEFLQVGGPQDESGSDFVNMSGHVTVDSYGASDAQQIRTVTFNQPPSAVLPFYALATDAEGNSSELTPRLYGADVFRDGFEN
jgi:hypothetical protein